MLNILKFNVNCFHFSLLRLPFSPPSSPLSPQRGRNCQRNENVLRCEMIFEFIPPSRLLFAEAFTAVVELSVCFIESGGCLGLFWLCSFGLHSSDENELCSRPHLSGWSDPFDNIENEHRITPRERTHMSHCMNFRSTTANFTLSKWDYQRKQNSFL